MNNIFGQFIIVCYAIFLIYWIINLFSIKKTVTKSSLLSWGTRLLAIFFFVAVYLIFKTYGAGPLLWPRGIISGLIADLFALSGLIVLIWARRTLGRNWSGNVVLKEDHELIQNGPYAYIRHPIYAGLCLLILSIAIQYGRLGGLIVFIIFFVGAWFRGHTEELLLTSHFGEKYLEYKKKTKALVPWVI